MVALLLASASCTAGRAGVVRSTPATGLWGSLHRPLHAPHLGSGAACPISGAVPADRLSPADFGSVPALGTGPVYPLDDYPSTPAGVFSFSSGLPKEGDLTEISEKWIAAPSYGGPVLIRGVRLDGTGRVAFLFVQSEQTASVTPELRFGAGGPTSSTGWREWAAATLVPTPGCYAYQMDGLTFSTIVVFRVA